MDAGWGWADVRIQHPVTGCCTTAIEVVHQMWEAGASAGRFVLRFKSGLNEARPNFYHSGPNANVSLVS